MLEIIVKTTYLINKELTAECHNYEMFHGITQNQYVLFQVGAYKTSKKDVLVDIHVESRLESNVK